MQLSHTGSEEMLGKIKKSWGKLREVRGKLRDKCPKFKIEDYCLLTSLTTEGSDNFSNFRTCETLVK